MDTLKPCPTLASVTDPLVWHLRPTGLDVQLDCGEYTTTFRTNSAGFRGPEFGESARVVFLGDSFVEAREVEEDQRFARLVDADAVVLGYAGSSPVHALGYYRHIGRMFSPDVVVHAFYAVNDIIEHQDDFAVAQTEDQMKVGSLDPHPQENWRLKLGRSSKLIQLVYDRVYRPLTVQVFDHDIVERKMTGPFYKFTKQGYADLEEKGAWEYTRAVMRTLKEEVEADGAKLLVVMIPPYFLVHEERQEALHALFADTISADDLDFTSTYNRLLKELRAEGLQIVDPLQQLQSVYEGGERVYFAQDPHITVRGHEVIAETLLPAVRSLLDQ